MRYDTNSGQHIDEVIDRVHCNYHEAPIGRACWYVRYDNGVEEGPAVCGERIRAAGFNGKIQPSSLRLIGGNEKSRFRR